MEIRKIGRRRPRSEDDAQFGYFTLLCKGRQRNVQRFITQRSRSRRRRGLLKLPHVVVISCGTVFLFRIRKGINVLVATPGRLLDHIEVQMHFILQFALLFLKVLSHLSAVGLIITRSSRSQDNFSCRSRGSEH